jgi:hypothetical protein
VLDAYYLLKALVRDVERQKLKDAVERHALVVTSDPILFEVICTFDLVDSIKDAGWRTQPMGLFEGGLHLRGDRDDDRLDFWYQQVPSTLSQHSRYRDVQERHQFGALGTLRPDVVMRRRTANGDRWLLVEMKMSGASGVGRTVEESARAALADLLAYRRDFGAAFTEGQTYGLGIAWGADIRPASGEVVLTTPEYIAEGVSTFLS